MSNTVSLADARAKFAAMRMPCVGLQDAFELALRFTAWASDFTTVPTAAQIQTQFNVSRATSYRWRAAWLAAKGLHAVHGNTGQRRNTTRASQ